MMSVMKRGMLIVFEGNDRAGKTTQALKLIEWLKSEGTPSQFYQFPDRSTPIGALINQYLAGEKRLNDAAIHLLFSANRWERHGEILKALEAGKTVVVDRYSYSGVAYTASKEGAPDFEWCRAPERGLLKPDCIIFLSTDVKMLQNRGDFGSEIYETSEFQSSVSDFYRKLRDDSWTVVEADRPVDLIHKDVVKIVNNKWQNLADQIARLW